MDARRKVRYQPRYSTVMETRRSALAEPTMTDPTKSRVGSSTWNGLHKLLYPIKRHNVFQTRHVAKETPAYIASRWILSCFERLLCIFIATNVTDFCTREGGGRLAVCHLSLSCPPPLVVPPQSMHSPGRSLDCAAGRAALLRQRPIVPSYSVCDCLDNLEAVSDAIAVQPHQRLAHALAFPRHCLMELPFKFQQSTL
jgi:hypothetical protein